MRNGIRVPNRLLIGVVLVGLVAVMYLARGNPVQEASNDRPRGEWLHWSLAGYEQLIHTDPDGAEYAAMLTEARDLQPRVNFGLQYTGLEAQDRIQIPAGTVYVEEGVVLQARPSTHVPSAAEHAAREAEAAKKLRLLRTVMEQHPQSPWGDVAAMHLGYTLVALERYEEAITPLERAMEALHAPYAEIHIPLRLANVYQRLGRLHDARRTLDTALQVTNSPYVQQLLAVVLEQQGDLTGAARIYSDLATQTVGRGDNNSASPPAASSATSFEVGDYWRSRFATKADELQKQAQRLADGDYGSVHGRVLLNGEALTGADVFLVHDLDRSVWPGPSVPALDTTTDASGAFAMHCVPPGRYRIGVRAAQQAVHGALVRFDTPVVHISPGSQREANVLFEKTPRIVRADVTGDGPDALIHVEWEEDPRAASYTLIMSLTTPDVSSAFALPEPDLLPTTATAVQLPLNGTLTGVLHGSAPRWGVYRVAELLGVRTPGATLHVQVIPLDEAGRPLFGSQAAWRIPMENANPYVATLPMPHFELTEAEALVAGGRWEEALAALEAHVVDQPHDRRALEMLTYLLRHGLDERGHKQDTERAQALEVTLRALVTGAGGR